MVPKHSGYSVFPNTVRTLRVCVISRLNLVASVQPIAEVRQPDTRARSHR
jgi:hypothetical protein